MEKLVVRYQWSVVHQNGETSHGIVATFDEALKALRVWWGDDHNGVEDAVYDADLLYSIVPFQVSGLRPEFPVVEDLPTIEEMSGLVEDFTAGKTLKEYFEDPDDL